MSVDGGHLTLEAKDGDRRIRQLYIIYQAIINRLDFLSIAIKEKLLYIFKALTDSEILHKYL